MLTPSANFTNAFKNSDVQPIFIIYITIGNDTYSYVSGQKPIFGYDPVVMDVSHGAPEIDIVNRSMTVGSFSITFAPDGVFKNLFVSNRLPGHKVVIKLGCYSIDESDFFQPYPPLMIKDIQPSVDRIVLECEDFTTIFSEREVGKSHFIAKNPLTCIRTILTLAGVQTAYIDEDKFDTTHIDNDDYRHYTISRTSYKHLIEVDNAFKQKYKALDAINELSELTRASFYVNTDGKFSLKRYNSLRVVDRHIPQHKIIEFTQGTLAENLANEILFTLAERTINQASIGGWDPLIVDTKHTTTWSERDNLSQTTHTPIGTIERVARQEHSSAWLNGSSRIFYPDPYLTGTSGLGLGSNTTSFVLVDAGISGFTGCRHRRPSSFGDFVNPSDADISNTHPAYLLIEGSAILTSTTALNGNHSNGATSITVTNGDALYNGAVVAVGTSTHHTLSNRHYNTYDISPALVGNQANGSAVGSHLSNKQILHREVISCNNVTIDDEIGQTYHGGIMEPEYSHTLSNYAFQVPKYPRYHIYNRGLFGTQTPHAWNVGGGQVAADGSMYGNKTLAWDISIPVLVTSQAITRFTNGAPRFKVRLPISEVDIEFGDFLTFDYDKFFMYGKSSLDNSSVFEVLKVEHQLTGATPGVYLDVAWVRNDLSYTPNLTYQQIVPMPYSQIAKGPYFVVDANGNTIYASSLENITAE